MILPCGEKCLSLHQKMASDCTDIDVVLRQINQRLRKLEKSDSEKTEEIGRLNRVINQKDVEIHNLKTELAVAKERIKELEEAADDTSSHQGSPRKTAATVVSLHPKKVSLLVSSAGQSLFASQAESRAVDSLATRGTHYRLLQNQT